MLRFRRIPARLALLTLVLGAVPALAGEDPWKSPEFQKQFLGTYGVLAEVEPRLSPEERAVLEKIIPLLSGNLAKAAEQLAAATTPASSALLDFTLGNIHFQLDQPDEAEKHYRRAVEKFPSFLRAYKNLGLVCVRLGNTADAIKAFTRMIELGGGDALSYGLLGQAYSAQEDFLAAESAYRQALLLQPDSLDWKVGLVRCLFREQKLAEAVAMCGELIEKYPDRADLWQLQASAYLGLKEPLKAAENYEMLTRLGHADAEMLYTLGDLYVNESLLDLAARAYLRALEQEGETDAGRGLRSAEILSARGATEAAKRILARIQERFGESLSDEQKSRNLKLQARIAATSGSGQESAKILEEILALNPLDGEALMLLAQQFAKTGEFEKAAFYLERAEGLEGFEADARVRHAQLLVRQSKFTEALPLLKRAQELKPREEVASYLEQVERAARSQR
ncbi:MAG TPA: tetratricopeptide repeat protein [Candidatus Polarisedimenticolia bacterium]|nr:tetratricopeptide repeat protein [Candidatus Polarisedimenticolia bacterium]